MSELNLIETWKIDERYSIASVSELPKSLYLEQFRNHLLQGYPVLPWRSSLNEDENTKFEKLKERVKDRFQLKLALLDSGKMIGWSYGWQDSVHVGDFYMAGSLVLPDYRLNGLYSKLVQKILEITRKEGFGAVRSRHICINNAVLIAKLKLGFFINGFEQDETMGTLVRMIYLHNELRRKAAVFRAGKVSEQDVLTLLTPDSTH